MIIQHYLQLLVHYRKLLIKIVLATTLGTAVVSLLMLFLMPLYTGTASVAMLPTNPEMAFTNSWMGSSQYNPTAFMAQTQVEYLISRPVAEKTLAKLAAEMSAMPKPTGLRAVMVDAVKGLKLAYYWTYNMLNYGKFVPLSTYEANLKLLARGLKVEVVEGSFVMQISMTLPDAKLAARAANLIAESYQERMAEQFSDAGNKLQGYFDQEIARREAVIDSMVNREIALGKELGILSIKERRDFLQTSLDAEQSALSAARVNLAVLEARVDLLKDQEGAVTLQEVLAQRDMDLAMEKVQRQTLRTTIAVHGDNISRMTQELEALAEKEEPLLKLTAQRQNAETDLQDFLERQRDVYLATYSSLSQAKDISPAQVPLYPAYPQVLIYTALGFIAGIFIAAFVLIGIDSTSSSVKTYSDLYTVVGNRAMGLLSPMMIAQARGRLNRFLRKRDFLKGGIPDLLNKVSEAGSSAAAPLQIVTFGERKAGVDCAVTLASAIGLEGRPVVCILPADEPRPSPCCNLQGTVAFVHEGQAAGPQGAVFLRLRPDVSPWDMLRQGSSPAAPFICALTAGTVAQDRLTGYFQAAQAEKVDYVLVAE